MDSQGREAMDQVEPQPLPGQPERPPGTAEPGGAQPDGPQPFGPAGMPSPGPRGGGDPGLSAGPARGAAGGEPRGEPQADSGLTIALAHPVAVRYDGPGPRRAAGAPRAVWPTSPPRASSASRSAGR